VVSPACARFQAPSSASSAATPAVSPFGSCCRLVPVPWQLRTTCKSLMVINFQACYCGSAVNTGCSHEHGARHCLVESPHGLLVGIMKDMRLQRERVTSRIRPKAWQRLPVLNCPGSLCQCHLLNRRGAVRIQPGRSESWQTGSTVRYPSFKLLNHISYHCTQLSTRGENDMPYFAVQAAEFRSTVMPKCRTSHLTRRSRVLPGESN